VEMGRGGCGMFRGAQRRARALTKWKALVSPTACSSAARLEPLERAEGQAGPQPTLLSLPKARCTQRHSYPEQSRHTYQELVRMCASCVRLVWLHPGEKNAVPPPSCPFSTCSNLNFSTCSNLNFSLPPSPLCRSGVGVGGGGGDDGRAPAAAVRRRDGPASGRAGVPLQPAPTGRAALLRGGGTTVVHPRTHLGPHLGHTKWPTRGRPFSHCWDESVR